MNPDIPGLLDLLQYVLDTLTNTEGECYLSPQPCRVALYPGGEAAWDVCESGPRGEGQLWANLQPFVVTEVGPGCVQIVYTAQIGVTRCESGSSNDGSPPSPAAVTADARQQGLDADVVLKALTCCFAASTTFERPSLVSWEPLGPSGGCYGGAWTIRGVVNVCC